MALLAFNWERVQESSYAIHCSPSPSSPILLVVVTLFRVWAFVVKRSNVFVTDLVGRGLNLSIAFMRCIVAPGNSLDTVCSRHPISISQFNSIYPIFKHVI